MANEPPKTPPAPTLTITMADLQKMMSEMAAAIKDGLATGMAAAEMARSKAAQEMKDAEAKARERVKQLGPPCAKCGFPILVCGGPVYEIQKDEKGNVVYVLDEKGEPKLDPKTKAKIPARTNVMVKGDDDNHTMMVVLPNSREAAKWFQGIIINSRRLLSEHPNHRIPVPKVNDIAVMLQAFEESEENFRSPRKASWDSGWVAFNSRPADGQGFTRPYTPRGGWRQ